MIEQLSLMEKMNLDLILIGEVLEPDDFLK